MEAGRSFDVVPPWSARSLTLYNSNQKDLLIWCGPIPRSDIGTSLNDLNADTVLNWKGDLEQEYLLAEPLEHAAAIAFVRNFGMPLRPKAYWEPLQTPVSEVHVVYEQLGSSFEVRGIV
tara:strand:- start:615 stop:971 length:357 start_codon:yes stop_codon:yes gene_type:complete